MTEPKGKHRLEPFITMAIATTVLVCVARLGDAVEAGEGRSWAILVGAQNYHRATNLRFTVNDVEQLAKTLENHGSYPTESILKMVDTAPNERFQPLCASMKAELPRWLAKPGPEDLVLVYFTGHGFRDKKDGKLYLAPLDFDTRQPAKTGVAIQWLRAQLAKCPAKIKLLIIDSCHAGSEKGENSESITAKELGATFRDMRDVVTVASSTDDQKSQMWPEMKQSLFSFWLNQGLKGHADGDGNSKVTIDEIFRYVHRHVTETAQQVFGVSQEPVRIVRTGISGVPTVLQLQPYPLKGTLENMAEQLANTMRINGLSRVAVAQFTASTTDPRMTAVLHNGPGLLGRECASELEKRLLRKRRDQFEVISHDALHKALSQDQYQVSDLRTTAIRDLSVEGKELPCMIISTLVARTGRVVSFQSSVVGTDDGHVYGTAGGTAQLSESEWAMLGHSAAAPHQTAASEDILAVAPSVATANATIQRLDAQAAKPHPLSDPAFPYRVRVKVLQQSTWVERPPQFRQNQMFVALRQGERYALWIENHTDKPVWLRLLVDGLNTLPEESTDKAAQVIPQDPNYPAAQRVSLADAKAWRVEARPPGKPMTVNAVSGFFRTTGESGSVIPFQVVDGDQSYAHAQQFTDQIGLITAAFYQAVTPGDRPREGIRSIGTGGGEEEAATTGIYRGEEKPGALLAAIHIRYVSPENMPQ